MYTQRWWYLLRRNSRTVALLVFCLLSFSVISSLLNSSHEPAPSKLSTRYMYQQSYLKYNNLSSAYHITVVADKDKASKTEKAWASVLLNGMLERDEVGYYSIKWDDNPITLQSQYNEGGRGMELSELVYYNKRLLSFDDRTGIVYEIIQDKPAAIPLHILMDGNGKTTKGFKCEWATVKDNRLFVGGLGKEWTTPEGEIINRDPQWVKVIDVEGRVEHQSWVPVYEALRTATGTQHPGYLIHEAVRFHPVQRRWFFLPRRASTEEYNDVEDEKRGTNLMISTDEHFGDIKVSHIGPLINTHGFSSFVFLPGRDDEVAALKTEEVDGVIASYLTVFNLDGRILLAETKIGDIKFEGIEII